MSKLSQKDAVFNAITEVAQVTRTEENTTPISLTKDEKSSVRSILTEGFNSGTISLKKEQNDMTKYVNGLVNNWLRKDTRLNGNVKYVTKNPGSRTGQSDAMVKNLRLLLNTTDDVAAKTDIEAAIAARLVEIKPVKKVVIDETVIPEELKHLL